MPDGRDHDSKGKCLFGPEIQAIDIAVRKIQGALVRLERTSLLVRRGNRVDDGEVAADQMPEAVRSGIR